MNLRPLLPAAILLLCSLPPAHAESCDDAATQAELNMCANTAFKQADQKLNEVYAGLKERYASDDGAASALTKAQRAWRAFRDAECELDAYPTEGGSIQPMVRLQCLARITEARTKQLEDRLNCEEGDFTCIPDSGGN